MLAIDFMKVGIHHYLLLSAIIFVIGMLTVLVRKNLIVMLMGIELMLNAVNISLVAFSHYYQQANGQVIVFFVMTIAAAEAAVGLALCVAIFKKFKKVDVALFENMRG